MGLRRTLRGLARWWRRTPAGRVDLGALGRIEPLSRSFGLDRGQPVDRHYIEAFLARHAEDIHGRVLECADPRYTRQFGGARVTHSEVLHPVPGNPRATRVGRLETGEGVPSESFDCIVLTQVLQYVFELDAAVATLHRALAPGGVLLLTVPATSKLSAPDDEAWGEHWRFTARSVRRLLEAHFPREQLAVEAHGNVLACVAFLQGLATEELSADQLAAQDPEFPLIITARAVR